MSQFSPLTCPLVLCCGTASTPLDVVPHMQDWGSRLMQRLRRRLCLDTQSRDNTVALNNASASTAGLNTGIPGECCGLEVMSCVGSRSAPTVGQSPLR
jgi:hypothetical protein